ncbi:hypothetical protein ACFV2I_05710 [Streptomyces microflavus]|uniref:Integral membrane protein n=2 Tax=Streptomyces microflavus TaxID=1919 RepID=A0A7H8MP43_STRMI|nr:MULTISPECIES: hypothetical protein [Streptomyces]MBW3359785.1 hypothetical protein [Streptomyces sp. 09ZI22]MEE1729564.1 hypothetical protein [Streptomyces sp. BE282]OXZ00089.1 hypothetical protein BEH93_31310 [Streptomyces sp. 2R]QKW44197.1 hypothetical protein HUT09_17515 [Streptomyces microflavus]QQZ55271.1 hypothetical protein IFE09_17840 [Streptomyces microflavus]
MSTPVAHAGAGLRLMRAAVFTAVCVVLSAAGHAFAAGTPVPAWTLVAGFLGILAVAAALAGRERSLPSIAGALAGGQVALHVLFAYGSHGSAQAVAASAPRGSGDNPLIRFAAGLVCGGGAGQLDAADAHRIVTTAGIDPSTLSQGHGHLASAGAATAAAPDGGPGLASAVADGGSGLASAVTDGGSGLASVYASVTALLPALPMFLAHLLAALAAGWLLRRGEAALFRLARLSAHGAQELAAGARLRSLRAALALVRALRAGVREQLVCGPRALRTADDEPAPATGDPLQHLVVRRGPPAPYALAA